MTGIGFVGSVVTLQDGGVEYVTGLDGADYAVRGASGFVLFLLTINAMINGRQIIAATTNTIILTGGVVVGPASKGTGSIAGAATGCGTRSIIIRAPQ